MHNPVKRKLQNGQKTTRRDTRFLQVGQTRLSGASTARTSPIGPSTQPTPAQARPLLPLVFATTMVSAANTVQAMMARSTCIMIDLRWRTYWCTILCWTQPR